MMFQATSLQDNSSPDVNWGLKAIMLGGGLAPALALIGITAVLPQIEAELASTATDKMLTKLLMTIVGLSMVIGAPLAGYLVDKIGIRKVLLASCLIYTVGGTAGLYLNDLPTLLASRLLLGVAAAAIAIIGMTLINTRFEGADRAKWMGGHIGFTLVGTLLIHPMVGLLGGFGWRLPFALYFIGALFALVTVFGIPEHRPQLKATASQIPQDRLLEWFPFRYMVLAFLIGTITYLPMVYLPFVMKDIGVSSPMYISLVLLADSVIGAIVALLFGRSQRYMSAYSAFIFSFTCTCAGMFIVAISPGYIGVVVGMLVYGFGVGWFVPNLMTASVRDVDNDKQGRAVGLVKSAHYLAAPLAVVLIEPVTRAMGPKGAMWVAALFSLLALSAFIIRSINQQRSEAILTAD